MRDLQRSNESITYTKWMHPQLVMIMLELEVEISCARSDPFEIKVVKIDVGWGCNDCKERFVTKMESKRGIDGVHLQIHYMQDQALRMGFSMRC